MNRTVLVSFSLAEFIVPLLIQGAFSTTFTFKNNCPTTVWPATVSSNDQLPLTGFQLDSGASVSMASPSGQLTGRTWSRTSCSTDSSGNFWCLSTNCGSGQLESGASVPMASRARQWSGRMWARTSCTIDASGNFSCLSGDCGSGQLACNGAGAKPPTTLVEVTLFGAGGKDFYDTSIVDGFNLPVAIQPQGGMGNCSVSSCPTNINSYCPLELQVKAPDGSVLGCKSACDVFGSDQYCCKGSFGSPNTCIPTKYSTIFMKGCPKAYSYALDDLMTTYTCTGANYLITFCP